MSGISEYIDSEVKGNASITTGKARDRFSIESSRFRKDSGRP